MSHVIGARKLPCGHHRIVAPSEPGTFSRKCDTCRVTFVGRVEESVVMSAKCGRQVLRASWDAENEKVA
jgi:hypothetical protein